MKSGDLTTLANAKAWLNVTSSADDTLLSRLVSAQSRLIQSWLNRRIAPQAYTEVRDGQGMGRGRYVMSLNNLPVYNVSSLKVSGIDIPQSADNGVLQPGYGFDSKQVWLAPVGPISNRFNSSMFELIHGVGNIVVKYNAGFMVLPALDVSYDDAGLYPAEAHDIPSASPYTVSTEQLWASDNGAFFDVGLVALTPVSGVPAVGQYSVSDGVYTFAAADAGKSILLSYGYIPADVEQACLEMVGLRFREKDRIGQVSKAVGSETVSFSQKDMPEDVKTLLNQYRKVFSF